jgi:hypothetical protein
MSSSAFTPTQTQITNNVPTNVPVVTAWEAYTPTISNITIGNGTVTAKYRRIGNNLQAWIDFQSGTTTTYSNTDWTFTIPSGLTIDSSIDNVNTGYFSFGVASGRFNDGGTGQWRSGLVGRNNSTSVRVFVTPNVANYSSNGWRSSTTGVLNNLASTSFSLYFEAPIAEWASSGTTTLATRAVEDYASNGGAAGLGTSDLTDFKYGPSGSLIGNLTSGLIRRVRFPTAILATDNLIVEVSTDRVMWFPMTCMQVINTAPIDLYTNQNGVRYGMGRLEKVNSTDVDVTFGLYSFAIGATYGSAGSNWATAGAGYWRVRRVSAGSQIGYPVSARNIVGDTSGTTVPTGMIGEIISSKTSAATNVTTAVYFDAATITLTASGTYRLDSSVRYSLNGATVTIWQGELFFGTTTGNNSTGFDLNENYWNVPSACTSAADCSINATQVINYNSTTGVVTFSSGATMTLTGGVLRLKSRPGGFTGGPILHRSFLTATRIA